MHYVSVRRSRVDANEVVPIMPSYTTLCSHYVQLKKVRGGRKAFLERICIECCTPWKLAVLGKTNYWRFKTWLLSLSTACFTNTVRLHGVEDPTHILLF